MMTGAAIAHRRLQNQHLAGDPFATPDALVRWLGAVQAQDYAAAKWAVAQRTTSMTDGALDQAFADGTILRTHVMRPTWHFVTPEDIRWMLALTAPRVKTTHAYACRQLGLDDALIARSNAALARALAGGRHLTRPELAAALEGAGIAIGGADGLPVGSRYAGGDGIAMGGRVTHLLMRAELDAIICSGARRGKQFTYALLEERAPNAGALARDEALALLAGRYFTSHGPATLRDFVWWSGLTMADAKRGVALAGSQLTHEVIEGRAYWFSPSAPPAKMDSLTAYLLPNYDEYVVGYADRGAVYDARHTEKLDTRGNVLFQHIIVIDGQVVGTWKRTLSRGAVEIEATPFMPLNDTEARAVTDAAEGYGAFLDLPVRFQMISHNGERT